MTKNYKKAFTLVITACLFSIASLSADTGDSYYLA